MPDGKNNTADGLIVTPSQHANKFRERAKSTSMGKPAFKEKIKKSSSNRDLNNPSSPNIFTTLQNHPDFAEWEAKQTPY
jgi:hypothetical protein